MTRQTWTKHFCSFITVNVKFVNKVPCKISTKILNFANRFLTLWFDHVWEWWPWAIQYNFVFKNIQKLFVSVRFWFVYWNGGMYVFSETLLSGYDLEWFIEGRAKVLNIFICLMSLSTFLFTGQGKQPESNWFGILTTT